MSIFNDNEGFWTFFHELFESIPRQGPGLDQCTDKALSFLPPLLPGQRVLDIGCGAGVQTLELARRCPADILAVDLHAPFLEILKKHAAAEGLDQRISTQVADMGDLPFPDASFDAVWAEGCSFIIGFAQGLARWKRLLKPGGHLVISEFTWFDQNPPAELVAFVFGDSKEDASPAGRRRDIAAAGYELVQEFPLPREGWWDTYYVPLLDQLPKFEERNAGHPAAMAVSEHCRQELDLFRRYPNHFGYMFFVMKC